ncbi:MAG: hypothetical protein ACE14P_08540 [Methanotrichaceae archaeon]
MRNPAILLCIGLIIGPLIILKSVSNDATYAEVIISLPRIIAGTGGGGLLTLTIINAGSRRRSRRAYRAIIGQLCDLLSNIYINFKYGNLRFVSDDAIILKLARGGDIDISNEINDMASLLHRQASSMNDEEYYNVPYKQKILYNVKNLVNIYFRDAIYNASDEKELDQLYSANSWGLQFINSLEGWGIHPLVPYLKTNFIYFAFS